MPDEQDFERIVAAILAELETTGALRPKPLEIPLPIHPAMAPSSQSTEPQLDSLLIDLSDPTAPEKRMLPGVEAPVSADSLPALMSTTSARIGVGRAGSRPLTSTNLLFLADLAITQDTLVRDVDEHLLQEMGLFTVQTCISGGKAEYLLRPDLGRQLSEGSKKLIRERCLANPQVQICVGDGLSAQAIEVNLRKIMPVMQQGFQSAGLSLGTPFFIKYCRVGVMNDIGDLLHPEVLLLLVGERPGLGRAESMSIYMGLRPQAGLSDAERDVICNIYDQGGTNPLEAGAYAVQLAQKMIRLQASGVKLKLLEK
jgi:ethanolamine ammonia-lyase small subunit